MKKKLIGILALSLLFSACGVKKDTYVSKRHPEDNAEKQEETVESTEESTDIKYTTSDGEDADKDNEENQADSQNQEGEENSQEGSEDVDGVEFLTDSTINMRLAPSTDSGVVVEVPGGATVIKIGENGEWTRATYEGYTGYILTELLSPAN